MPSSIAVATRDDSTDAIERVAQLRDGAARARCRSFRSRRHRGLLSTNQGAVPVSRRSRFELSASDVVRAATEGGRFVVDRFDVDDAILDRVEEGGRLDVEGSVAATGVREELPWSVVQLSRMASATSALATTSSSCRRSRRSSTPGRLRSSASRRDSSRSSTTTRRRPCRGELGALFARRKRAPLPLRAQMTIGGASPAPRERAFPRGRSARRLNLYFLRQPAAVPRDGEETPI